MKKAQRYQQLGQRVDDDDHNEHSFEPYRDELPEVSPPSSSVAAAKSTINRALSSASDHPLASVAPPSSRPSRAKGVIRSKSQQPPAVTRLGGSRSPLRRRAPSRENSFQDRGSSHSHTMLDTTLGGLLPDVHLPPLRYPKDDKDSDSSPSADGDSFGNATPRHSSVGGDHHSHPGILEQHDDDDDDNNNTNAAEGKEDDRPQGLWNSQSISSGSFDLLDDEDELNLQRYHLDFDDPWDPEGGGEWDTSARTYEPQNGEHGNGKPWISMVQSNSGSLSPNHNSQHHHHHSFSLASSLQSAKEFWMYLHALRRQARQRRAQRLLTMPSERWWQRLQFCVITYCWDATDVGLMVVAILFALWFLGLIWYSYWAMHNRRAKSNQEAESQGAEYSGNAPYDKADQTSTWQSLFQWWWWGLGLVLMLRILGPLAVQRVDLRRRNRRRRRFESDNIERQRRLQQQQQLELQQQGSSSPQSSSSQPTGRAHADFAYPPTPTSDVAPPAIGGGGDDPSSSSSSSSAYIDVYEDEDDQQPSVEMS